MTSRNQTITLIIILLLLLWMFAKDVLETVVSWFPWAVKKTTPVDAEHPAPNTGEFEPGGGEFGGHGAGGTWFAPPVDQNQPTPAAPRSPEPIADPISEPAVPLPLTGPVTANPPAYRPPPSAAPDPSVFEPGYDIQRGYIGDVAHYEIVPRRSIV